MDARHEELLGQVRGVARVLPRSTPIALRHVLSNLGQVLVLIFLLASGEAMVASRNDIVVKLGIVAGEETPICTRGSIPNANESITSSG